MSFLLLNFASQFRNGVPVDLSPYIDNPRLLNRETLVDLRRLAEAYPFYQAARLLYVENLYMLHDNAFGEQLRRASLLIPDRSALFRMVEEPETAQIPTTLKPKQSPILTENEDRTTSLIDDFLSGQQSDVQDAAAPHAMPTVADVTSDYAAFLAQQGDLSSEDGEDEDPQRPSMTSLIENFLDSTRGKQRYELPAEEGRDAETAPASAQATSSATETGSPFYNEKIVGMLMQQGHYAQALEILRRICLNNPEKSATFATQIHLLEVIVAQQGDGKPAKS